MTTKYIAFHGDGSLKKDMVEELENHRLQDQFIAETYGSVFGDKWRGCASQPRRQSERGS